MSSQVSVLSTEVGLSVCPSMVLTPSPSVRAVIVVTLVLPSDSRVVVGCTSIILKAVCMVFTLGSTVASDVSSPIQKYIEKAMLREMRFPLFITGNTCTQMTLFGLKTN